MYFECCLLILLFILVVCIIFVNYANIHFKIKRSQYSEIEIGVIIHLLDKIISQYKLLFFQENYEALLKKYDIDNNSPTKSRDQFKTEYEKLLHETTNEIMSSYIPKEMKDKMFKYFTVDSLL